jgi:hypothetical protein
MVKKVPEPVFTDESHTYVFVPVKTAPPVTFRIIQMNDFEVSDANLVIELCKGVCDARFRSQLISRSKRVTGVKTDPGTAVIFNPVEDSPYVLKTAADTVLLSCGVLKKQHNRSV